MEMHELFLQEAARLAKDALILTTTKTSSGIVGHWGGNFVQTAPFKRHQTTNPLFSLSKKAVPVPSEGLTAYHHQNPDGLQGHQLIRKEHQVSGAQPLYARLKKSLPPLQAVCLYGSIEVEHWLQDMNLTRMDYWQLPADLEETYNDLVRYEPWQWWGEDGVAMVMNPWPVMWPDDEVYPIAPAQLVAATLKDGEPYLQVWWSEASGGWWLDLKST